MPQIITNSNHSWDVVMDRNFAKCLSLVLRHEGGYVNHPQDPGGHTNRGITLSTFRRYIKPSGTVEDLKRITPEQVATCYRRFYWDAVSGAELPDGIDYAVFDFAVNSGPDRAAKYLQKVAGVTQDGKIGPATIKATRDKLPAGVINRLCDDRLTFLKRLKTWSTFGKGWSTRVKDVRSVALEMSAAPTPEKPKVIVKEVPVVETVEVEKPVVPQKVEEKVKEKADWLSWLTGGGGLSAIGLGWLTGMDWQAVLAGGVVLVVVLLLFLLLRSQIIAAVRGVREAVEN